MHTAYTTEHAAVAPVPRDLAANLAAALSSWPGDTTGVVPAWVIDAWASEALIRQRQRLQHVPRTPRRPIDRWPVLRLVEDTP